MQITAVVPAYNYGHVLEGALVSILAQTRRVARVIVVDDGSTDDTAEVVAAFARLHGELPIQYIRQNNAGPSAARNHGVRLAATDWVAFLDADDTWYPNKLEKQTAFANRYPEAALLFAGVDIESRDGVRKPTPLPYRGIYPWRTLLFENWVFSPTPLVKRDIFLAAGGFDESRRHAEDWDCWLRMAELAPAAGQPEILACYGEHGAGLHTNDRMIHGSYAVLSAALARCVENLRRGDADRAFAALLGSEAVAAAGRGDLQQFVAKARHAQRLGKRQLPRMAWAALFAIAKRRLYA